jgi:hypothetical protein
MNIFIWSGYCAGGSGQVLRENGRDRRQLVGSYVTWIWYAVKSKKSVKSSAISDMLLFLHQSTIPILGPLRLFCRQKTVNLLEFPYQLIEWSKRNAQYIFFRNPQICLLFDTVHLPQYESFRQIGSRLAWEADSCRSCDNLPEPYVRQVCNSSIKECNTMDKSALSTIFPVL